MFASYQFKAPLNSDRQSFFAFLWHILAVPAGHTIEYRFLIPSHSPSLWNLKFHPFFQRVNYCDLQRRNIVDNGQMYLKKRLFWLWCSSVENKLDWLKKCHKQTKWQRKRRDKKEASMHLVLGKSMCPSKLFVFALALNILETPKYTIFHLWERKSFIHFGWGAAQIRCSWAIIKEVSTAEDGQLTALIFAGVILQSRAYTHLRGRCVAKQEIFLAKNIGALTCATCKSQNQAFALEIKFNFIF